MDYPKSPGLYCIDDFKLRYTPFSKIREEKVTGRSPQTRGLRSTPTNVVGGLSIRSDDLQLKERATQRISHNRS